MIQLRFFRLAFVLVTFLFTVLPFNAGFAQSTERMKISTEVWDYKPYLLYYSGTEVKDEIIMSADGQKVIRFCADGFIVHDNECNFQERIPFDFNGIDEAAVNMRVRQLHVLNDGYLAHVEMQDKKETTSLLVCRLDKNLKSFGEPFLVASRPGKSSFLRVEYFYIESMLSDDKTKLLFYYPVNWRYDRPKKYSAEYRYLVYDVKSNIVKQSGRRINVEKGNFFDSFIDIGNDGIIHFVYTFINKAGKNQEVRHCYTQVGEGADTNRIELPWNDTYVYSLVGSLKGDRLELFCSYQDAIRPFNDQSDPDHFSGVTSATVDVKNRTVLESKKIQASSFMSDPKKWRLEKGTLMRKPFNIRFVNMDANGDAFIFLSYRYRVNEYTQETGPYLLKVDKVGNVAFFKSLSLDIDMKNENSFFRFTNQIYHVKNGNMFVLAVDNEKNMSQGEKYYPTKSPKTAVLTLLKIDRLGNITRTFEGPMLTSDKFYYDLRRVHYLDKTNSRIYLSLEKSNDLFKLKLASYTIPVDL